MTREEAINILWRYDVNFEPHPAEEVMHAIDMAIEALRQPERKTGRWIDKSDGLIEGAWNYCSVCGEQAIDLYDYCPNCGARMDGEAE